MTKRITFQDPSAGPIPPSTTSCEHCLTVTWAGRPACSCEFGRLVADEELAWRLRHGIPQAGEGAG